MSATLRDGGVDGKEFRAFLLAVEVLRDRISCLHSEDRKALHDLIPYLFSEDEEDRDSAMATAREIIVQPSGNLKRMEMSTDISPELENWVSYMGRTLTELRKKAGLTQETLAELSGIPQSHISRLENGLHSPSAKTVEKLATALGLKPSDLDPSSNDA